MKFRVYNRISLIVAVVLAAGVLLGGCGEAPTATAPTAAPTLAASANPATSPGPAATTAVRSEAVFLRPYPEAVPFDLGKDYDAALKSREAALLGNQVARQISSQKYLTSDTTAQVMTYYEPELFRLGYKKVGRIDISLLTIGNASTLAVLFANGTAPDASAVLVTTIGPLAANDIAQLISYNAEATKRIKEKDIILTVFSGISLGQIPNQIIIPDTSLFSTRPNVPLYPQAEPLDLGAGFYYTINQALVGLIGQEASTNTKLNFYRMPTLSDDFWKFYDTEMPKLNYKRLGQVDVGSVAAIGKVKSQAILYATQTAQPTGTMIIAVGPWSAEDYGLLTKIVLLARQNFKAGETMLLIVSNIPLSNLSPNLIKTK